MTLLDVVRWLWAIMALIGVVVHVQAVSQAQADYHAAAGSRGSVGLRYLAYMVVRNEVGLLAVQFILLVLAMWVIVDPASGIAFWRLMLRYVGLSCISVVLWGNSIVNQVQRRNLSKMLSSRTGGQHD